MFRQSIYLCCVLFMALAPFTAMALTMTPEQKAMIHEHFEKVGLECIKDVPITEDDIVNLRARKLPTGDNAPCFIACIMRKIGLMDDKGMLQKENALELAKKVFNDADEIQIIHDYLHSCASVNDKAVGDGDKGCDRAILAYTCMAENASQFGFDV